MDKFKFNDFVQTVTDQRKMIVSGYDPKYERMVVYHWTDPTGKRRSASFQESQIEKAK